MQKDFQTVARKLLATHKEMPCYALRDEISKEVATYSPGDFYVAMNALIETGGAKREMRENPKNCAHKIAWYISVDQKPF